MDRNGALLECGRWLENVPAGDPWRAELEELANDGPRRTDAFYKNLAFGTGGLRAAIGAGSNRMNHYVVGRATRGLANYIKKTYPGQELKACVAYDTRRCSEAFARHCARVLSACGVRVYLFAQARPTPMLSFAVKRFGAQTGIVITASHNPKQDNGYKAYNATGGQLTDEAAGEVLQEINALDYFDPLPETGSPGGITELDEAFDETYYAETEKYLPRGEMSRAHGGELKLLYTPLHGSGLAPVTGLLARLGYADLAVVKRQRYQDRACSFPTVKKPNPEETAVFAEALAMAGTSEPDVIFATDPDADRIGVLARDKAGNYIPFTGTQMGALLCDYVIQSYKEEKGGLPPKPAVVTTIVTGTLAQRVCGHPGNNVHVEL
ncbi:MAG: phospho-sugar mutase, partial [Oscillospiraceae bacterium]|nr:phospho-sugar mutase [Oscillospiraceae bacterium]